MRACLLTYRLDLKLRGIIEPEANSIYVVTIITL